MEDMPDPLNVRRYDAVVETLVRNPGISFEDAARRCGVSASTVGRIWDGRIARPPVVLLDRLPTPRRCPDCGARCNEWPCILCEIRRRTGHFVNSDLERPVRFKYRSESK